MAATATAPASTFTSAAVGTAIFSSLSVRCHLLSTRTLSGRPKALLLLPPPCRLFPTPKASASDEAEPEADDDASGEKELDFDFPTPPEGYLEPTPFDELPEETEEQIMTAYEELYGPAFSGETFLGNDVFALKRTDPFLEARDRRPKDDFVERVLQVSRVTKVVKGGKQLTFRAVVVIGDMQGHAGVGVGKAKEAGDAILKAARDARKNVVTVPLTKYGTFPHRATADYGAARVMLRPACPGSSLLASGAVRIVLDCAGVVDGLGKQVRSQNPLNNARATLKATQMMRTFPEIERERGIPMQEMWK